MNKQKMFCEFQYADRPVQIDRHYHDTFEMIFICEGEAYVETEGSEYTAKAGTILFFDANNVHRLKSADVYRRYTIRFSSQQIVKILVDPVFKAVFSQKPLQSSVMLRMHRDATKMETILKSMYDEYMEERPLFELRVKNLMNDLFILCYRQQPEFFVNPDMQRGVDMQKTQKYIEKHFRDTISAKELARELYMSPSYFAHTFKAWTGYSVFQYQNNCRIDFAKKNLLECDDPVYVIAIRSGFADVNTFIRAFKRDCGQSPGKYRKQHKMKEA